jgi:hypothetical protein
MSTAKRGCPVVRHKPEPRCAACGGPTYMKDGRLWCAITRMPTYIKMPASKGDRP